ncbi:MAG: acyl-CoA dehydratase activase [Armatimonadota bacterium]|nr:acyl-CoA dehydratase activase [Armatimonadota bacterium]MCX7778101.1 acyl-CoA dehydratase activase [Armatimonadota bacterium]MDW8026162.1 acyl-CoA dehydratase activase [Armatimonadota bacterium]
MSYYAGVDVGSVSCKAAIVDASKQLLASAIVPTGAYCREAALQALSAAIERARVNPNDLAVVVATGYGRDNVECRAFSVTEITCHAVGAIHLFPKTRLVIDVGGQDCKAIRVDERGTVIDFVMNDKCAAGTGRFFEVMAKALGIELEDFGEISLKASKQIKLSSVCTVFAESEVISLIARGERVENILLGLCLSAAERVKKLAQKVGIIEEVTITGGVARNIGFIEALSKLLGVRMNIPEEPQIVGAIGAALIALEKSEWM